MPVVHKKALVSHSTEQMFRLVCDVESYPKFLPSCRSARLISQDDNEVCGELEVVRLGISQTFSTRNLLHPYERVDIQLISGPFKQLRGYWIFTPLNDHACRVELKLEFEFSGRMINAAFGKAFGQIANTMVSAFCKRAKEVYRDV